MTGAKRWMIWILPDTDWQAWRSQPGTLQNLGRDDLEVFSTIKDPFGRETKSCSKSSRPIGGWRWSEVIPDLAFQADPL